MDDDGAFVPGPRAHVAGSSHGPLKGMGFAAKDLFDVAGTRTGAGNPDFLADAPVATKHAPAVAALLEEGADLVGKTVTDELAFSLSGTNVHYGTPNNPVAPGRVPGGSSSGSASAVACGLADFALGTDTGGSVRVPASYCGLYGLRPTHGRISVEGVVPLARSFDTVGLLATDGAVLRSAWSALAAHASSPLPVGEAVRDAAMWRGGPSAGAPRAGEPRARAPRAVSTLVCPPELLALLDEDARLDFEPAADELGRLLGCRVVERSVLPPEELVRLRTVFRTVQLAEAWRSHGSWIERRHPSFGPGVRSRFEAASQVDPNALEQLPLERRNLLRLLGAALGDDELLLQPAASGAAPPIDLDAAAKDNLRLRTLTLTAPAGIAGVPVVALPLARVDGLPLGLALVAAPGEDELLVDCAARLSSALQP